MMMKLPIAGAASVAAAAMMLVAVISLKGSNQGKPADLRGVRKMQQLVPPTNIGGTVNGGGTTSGFTNSTGQAEDTDDNDDIIFSGTSDGNGSVKLDSGGSGFVETIFGGTTGNAASGLALTSKQAIGGTSYNDDTALYGLVTAKGTSTASSAGNFAGAFNPSASKGPVTGTGSGTGSFKVEGGGTIEPSVGNTDANGYLLGSGTANIFGGGSATSFNDKVSAGGQGSGASGGGASSVFGADDDAINEYVVVNTAATGTFAGIGSGNNLPNQGGSAQGSGNGGGTALVDLTAVGDDGYVKSNLDANFNSTGGGSSFVTTPFGGASGNAAGGSFGAAAGELLAEDDFGGTFTLGGSSAANGVGAFVSGFTPAGLAGPTGGVATGVGSLNVTGSATLDNDDDADDQSGSGSGSATSFGGGQATGFNLFGEAGALAAGSTVGSAFGDFLVDEASNGDDQFLMGAGAATGNFNTIGSGSFGQPASLAAP